MNPWRAAMASATWSPPLMWTAHWSVNGGEDVEEESSSSDDVVAANPLANTQSNNTESIVKIRLADDILLCALLAFQSICKRDFGCNELKIFSHTHTHSHMLQHVLEPTEGGRRSSSLRKPCMIGARLLTYIKAKISLSLCLVVSYLYIPDGLGEYWWQKLRNTISRCWYQFYKKKKTSTIAPGGVSQSYTVTNWSRHVRKRAPKISRATRAFIPSFFFLPSNGLCVVIPGAHIALEVLSSYSPWHFSYHLALPFWLLF